MVIRLDKYLCDMQAGTRSAVKDIIRKKRVTINGEVITRPEIKVDIDKDVVAVDNNVLGYSEYEYYMLNKPAGVVSAVSDETFPLELLYLKMLYHPDCYIEVSQALLALL